MANNINFLGSYSGIDSATIDSMIQAESGKVVQYTNKQTSITAEKNAWKDINTRLDSLFTKLGTLGEDKTFQSKLVTSSDATKVAITAGTDSIASNYSIEVNRLATSTQVTSGEISLADGKTIKESLGLTGKFTVTSQAISGTPEEKETPAGKFEIDITAKDSLKDIVGKINEKSKESGIQAKIVDNRIIMTDSNMGERTMTFDGKVTNEEGITTDTGIVEALGFGADDLNRVVKTGQSAELTIDGIKVTRDTNTITNAVDGLTIELKGVTEASKPVTIEIKEDTDTSVKAFESFVEQYNSTLNFISDQLDVGNPSAENNKTGALAGDSSLIRLQSSLRSLMTQSANTGNTSYNNLESIGISVDRYGKATLDKEKLKVGIADDPTAVKKILFQTTSTETTGVVENGESSTVITEKKIGLAQKIQELVNTYISDKTGIIKTKSATYDKLSEDLTKSITKFNERLEKKRANYVTMFSRLDTAMMQAESQMAYLQSQLNTEK